MRAPTTTTSAIGSAVRVAVVTAVALSLMVSALTASGWAPALRRALGLGPPDPTQSLETWVAANVDPAATIIADPDVRAALIARGLPASQILPAAQLTEPADSLEGTTWRGFDYVISTPDLRGTATGSGPIATALSSSTPVMAFGAGDDTAALREIDPDGVAAADRTAQEVAATSRQQGVAMTASGPITFAASAAQVVESGVADPRLLAVLVGLSGQHHIRVADVTDPDAGDQAPTHFLTAVISQVDGSAVRPDSPATSRAVAWLLAQPTPYQPATVTPRAGALVLTYRLPLPIRS